MKKVSKSFKWLKHHNTIWSTNVHINESIKNLDYVFIIFNYLVVMVIYNIDNILAKKYSFIIYK